MHPRTREGQRGGFQLTSRVPTWWISVRGGSSTCASTTVTERRDRLRSARPTPDPPRAMNRRVTPSGPPPRVGQPPQFVVVSFDGSGGARLWGYWRSVARQAHAHFTFFVSGVYLIDWADRLRYHPPRHAPGSSDIGFGSPGGELDPAGTLRQIAAAYHAGPGNGTQYNR